MDIFLAVFAAAWVMNFVYVAASLRLAFRIHALKRQGRAQDVPDLFHALDAMRALPWLLTGRFAEVDDEIVQRWARRTRVLFFIAAPLTLGVFALLFFNLSTATN